MLVKSSSSLFARRSRIGKLVSSFAVGAALLSSSALAQVQGQPVQAQVETDPEVQQELLQVREQLENLESRIKDIEDRALQGEELQAAQAQYYERLKSVAIKKTPAIRSKIERQDVLIEELKDDPELGKPAAERSETFNEKLGEFRQLRSEITPVVQSVVDQPEVQEEYGKFQEKMVEEMKEIDPTADQLLAQRDQLFEQYQQLTNRIQ